jgi:hypothetical protein
VTRRRRASTLLRAVAALLALGASAMLLVVPFVNSSAATQSSGGPLLVEERSMTLLESEGPGVLVVLAVPVLLTALPLVFRPRWLGVVCTAVLGVLVVVTGFSIGLLYLPALVAALVAVSWPEAPRSRAQVARGGQRH